MLHRRMRPVQHGDVQIYTVLTTLWLGMLKTACIFKRLRVDCPVNGLMVSTRFLSPIWTETFLLSMDNRPGRRQSHTAIISQSSTRGCHKDHHGRSCTIRMFARGMPWSSPP